jgi:RimJ/RimL family protein N-acetyltransferase
MASSPPRRIAGQVLAHDLLRLEPLDPGHLPGLREAAVGARDRPSMADVPTPGTIEAFVARSLARAEDGQYVPFAQIDLASGRIVGHTAYLSPRFFADGRLLAVEVGSSWLAPAARGTALNSASKLVLFAHAFEDWDVARLDIKTDARNERARAGIAAVGGRFEGVLRAWQPSQADGENGAPRDTAIFSITAGEWPGVRARLSDRVERKRRRAGV